MSSTNPLVAPSNINGHHASLEEVTSPVNASELKALLEKALSDNQYEREQAQAEIWKFCGERANETLCLIMQALRLEEARKNNNRWLRLRRLSEKLCRESEVQPRILFLDNIECEDRETPESTSGGQADIFIGNYGSKTVAIKRVRGLQKGSDEFKRFQKKLLRESIIWSVLDHAHILPLFGLDKSTFKNHTCIVLPWMVNGDIVSCTERMIAGGREVPYRQWILEVAEGLNYLHWKEIIHGDIRGRNILVDENFRACITDFGLATITDATRVGTLRTTNSYWLAPELIDSEVFEEATKESDIYAFGCTSYEIYTHKPPLYHFRPEQAVLRLSRGDQPAQTSESTGRRVPDDLWDVVQACIGSRADRPKAEGLVEVLRA